MVKLELTPQFISSASDLEESISWVSRDAKITDANGGVIFQQDGVEFPDFWSETAVKIVTDKYFRGIQDTDERETSLKQVVNRVVDTITQWGIQGGYFDKENAEIFNTDLKAMIYQQIYSFNSPVWFNVGVEEHAAVSACFINGVEDSMESIVDLQSREAMIFKNGSGAGSNLSNLRARNESLSSGGKSSGPLSFMKGFDAFAGVIRSGGKCLAPWQKVYTEKGPIPVSELVDKDFIVLSYDQLASRFKAKKATAWLSGRKKILKITTDKGEFTLSKKHPVKLSDNSTIYAKDLKPGMSLFSCTISKRNGGYLSVGLKDGQKTKESFHRLIAMDVLDYDINKYVVHHIDGNKENNSLDNLKIMTAPEHLRAHALERLDENKHAFQKVSYSHKDSDNGMHSSSDFWKNTSKVKAYKKKQSEILLKDSGRAVKMQKAASKQKMLNTAFKVLNAGYSIDTFLEYIFGREMSVGIVPNKEKVLQSIKNFFGTYNNFVKEVGLNNHRVISVEYVGVEDVYSVEVECKSKDDKSPTSGHNFVIWPDDENTGSGIVVFNTRRAAKMTMLNIDHLDIREFVESKVKEEEKVKVLVAAGYSPDFTDENSAYSIVAFQNENHSVGMFNSFMEAVKNDGMWELKPIKDTTMPSVKIKAKVLFRMVCDAAWKCGDPGLVFLDLANEYHTCPKSGAIRATNPCLHGSTLMQTRKGLIPICDLVDKDFEVVGANGEWVKAKGLYSGKKETIKLFLSNGLELIVTPDHQLALDSKKLEFLEAKNINPTYSVSESIHDVDFERKSDVVNHLRQVCNNSGSFNEKYNVVSLHVTDILGRDVIQWLCMLGIKSHLTCMDGEYYVIVSRKYLEKFNQYLGFDNDEQKKLDSVLEYDYEATYLKIYVKTVEDFGECDVYDFSVASEAHCGGAGGILVHNCGEYIDIDDSACNLGSLNLKKFVYPEDSEGGYNFDVESFVAAARIATIAQEILIDNASYPNELIGNNTRNHRQLGVGYSNLGASLMYCGLPYDSDEGRNFAASITSLLTGSVYYTSTLIAEVLGPFKEYEVNKESMLDVMQKHYDSTLLLSSENNEEIVIAVCEIWKQAIIRCEKYGIRNSKASVLAPTGTISFMMDCDTTGAEPELMLIKYKSLVGGGTLKIVNETVAHALTNLGYNEKTVKDIIKYIEVYNSVDGCELINKEHVPIFDTSYGNTRSISSDGHVKMLGAIQPFISGGISKTVNLPKNATVEDVEDVFMLAYDLKVKAVTIYRDGSKGSQPLNASADDDEEIIVSGDVKTNKRKMPAECRSFRHGFNIAGHQIYMHIGFYSDGKIGELFLRAAKEGSTMNGFLDSIAILTSTALQYGVPLKVIVNKLSHVQFEPSGYSGNKDIGFAKSIVDYIFRYIGKYVDREEHVDAVPAVSEKLLESAVEDIENMGVQSDSPLCTKCGHITTRRGSCYYCDSCHTSTGCS